METQHVHWKSLVNPNYIGAYCVTQDTTYKITAVNRETVKGEGGKSEECTIAHLEGSKPFIVNRTNAKTITKLHGTPFIDEWVGKLITIYPTTTKVAGENVDCLRIRTTKPVASKPIDYTNIIATLKNCTTLEQLQFEYTNLNADAKAATLAVKDAMKIQLTPKPDADKLL